MGVRRPADPAEATQGKEGGPAQQYMDLGPHAEPPPGSVQQSLKDKPTGRGGTHQPVASLRNWLPRGGTLDHETFQQRHRFLCWLLGLHVVALLVFGLWRGVDAGEVLLSLTVPTGCLLLARLLPARRINGFFIAAGLVFCSALLVYFSGGSIEAHFHFFVLIGFIALYQDWAALLWNAVFVVLSHGFGSALAADAMYNHPAAQNNPWLWAGVHGVAVLGACLGIIVYWHHAELVQQRNIALTNQLAAAEVANAQTEVGRRQSISALLVHLARRNQSLLDRQLGLIADLEQQERAPETLSELFKLDHLATRMRRNAESLLVLSGEEPPRRWGRPVPLVEVVRAAAAEVEDYERVEVLVGDHLHVEGRVVADLAHLLAELIENATIFSPPDTEVRVQSYPSPGHGSGFVLSIEDMGIGMSENDLRKANQLLAEAPEVDLRWMTLGFHVVSRLAHRYNLDVRVASTPGGGVTALVTLPPGLVSERVPTMFPAGTTASPTSTGETPSVAHAPHSAGTAGGMALPPAGWMPTEAGTGELPPPPRPPEGLPRPLSLPPGHTPPLPTTPASRAPSLPPPPSPPQDAPLTGGGLVRRVPGARLAPPLRGSSQDAGREPGEAARANPPVPGDDGSAGTGDEGPWNAWGGPTSESLRAHDSREHVRSMLSRFQASQRAARAVAESGPAVQAEEPHQVYEEEPEKERELDQPGGSSQRGWLSRFEASQQAGRAVAGAPASEFTAGAAVSADDTGGSPGGHFASRYGSSEANPAELGRDPVERVGRDPYRSVPRDQDGPGHEALEEHEEQGGDQDG